MKPEDRCRYPNQEIVTTTSITSTNSGKHLLYTILLYPIYSIGERITWNFQSFSMVYLSYSRRRTKANVDKTTTRWNFMVFVSDVDVLVSRCSSISHQASKWSPVENVPTIISLCRVERMRFSTRSLFLELFEEMSLLVSTLSTTGFWSLSLARKLISYSPNFLLGRISAFLKTKKQPLVLVWWLPTANISRSFPCDVKFADGAITGAFIRLKQTPAFAV
jgi:hypothetical protein